MTTTSAKSASSAKTARAMVPTSRAFKIASTAYVMVFASAGAPIPLYELYRAENGIATGDLAFGAVGYFAGTLLTLLLFGRLADHLGRKPVMLASLAFAITGTTAMIAVHDTQTLFIARLLQGIASGLAVSGLGAYIVDTAPTRPAWLPTMITGSGPMVGIPIGALSAGLLVEIAPAPRVLTFIVVAALLLALALGLILSPETSARTLGAIGSLRPQMTIPPASGRLFVAISAAFVGSWCIGGLYQSFAPTFTVQQLSSENALLAAVVFSSIMILAPVGGPIAGRLGETRTICGGALMFALANVGALVCLSIGAVAPFLLASAVGGISQGAIAAAGNRALLSRTQQAQRGALLSTVFVVSYSGAALPALIASQVAGHFRITQVYSGYLVFTFVCTITVLLVYPWRSSSSS